jgi:hypothetical protein
MCCGVSQNTYHTLKDMRIVFVDGTGGLAGWLSWLVTTGCLPQPAAATDDELAQDLRRPAAAA